MKQITLELEHKTITLELDEALAADPKLLNGGHPLGYVIRMNKSTAYYLSRLVELFRGLPEGMDVQEFCGGIGLIPMATWDILKPASWTAIELDPNCIKAYACREAVAVLGDMFVPRPITKDLVVVDNPNNTLPKMWREPKRAEFYRRIADARPRYLEITDVGYYWIHLANHWPIYQGRFGVQVSRGNYHELFDQFMRETYGYKVIKWTVGGGAQYFLLTPT